MSRWANNLSLLGDSMTVWVCLVAVAFLGSLVLIRWHIGVRRMVVCLAVAVTCAALAWVGVDLVWRPFPEQVGMVVWTSLAVMVLALGVAVMPAPRGAARRWPVFRALVAGLFAICLVVCMLVLVNLHFRTYTTLGDVLGTSVDRVPLNTSTVPAPVVAGDGQVLADVWTPPTDMPATGTLSLVMIPGTTSGFVARSAMVYLPPAYSGSSRPLLPVMILMTGQPGSPIDWQTGGHLQQTMDQWAAAHSGLAPIVVVPDNLGHAIANPLCSDTSHGKMATYLQQDVPNWITGTLQVDPNTTHWVVAGASNGATCSLQMVTRDSDRFGSFIALSPEFEPSRGDRQRTIDQGFDGDAGLFAANNPADLLTTRTYPGAAGRFVVGDQDPWYRDAAPQLDRLAKASGMDTEVLVVPGGHSWQVWATGLGAELDWAAKRTGITG